MSDTRPEMRGNGSVSAQSETLTEVLLGKRRDLARALGEIEAEVIEVQTELSKKIDDAWIRRQSIEEALGHVEALLRIEGWVETGEEDVRCPQVLNGNRKAPADAALDLLSTLGKPLHYRLMAQQLSDSGVYLAGKDPAATLLSKMSRDDRFKRAPERGVYGLATWRMQKSSSGKRRAKPRGSRTART